MIISSQDVLVERPGALSRSKPVSAWSVFIATVIKDLQIERRYLPDMIGKVIELAVRLLFYLMLSGIISVKAVNSPLGQEMTNHDLFIFFQGGLLLFVFSGTALSTPVNSVARDLNNGTLEFLYSNPSSRYAYFVGGIVANAIISQIVFLPLYLFLVISSGATLSSMLMVLAVCMTVLVTLIALGIMIALLGLLWRQVGAVTTVLAILFEMLSGAYFPVSVFPPALRAVTYLLPYTWGYDLIRYYSFDGRWQPLIPVWAEWSLLVVYAVGFTIASRYLLKRAEQRAKQQGLNLI